MSINKFNSEGYYDPTAFEAMSAVEKEEKALRAFRPIVYICSPYAGDVPAYVENARMYCRFDRRYGCGNQARKVEELQTALFF